MEMIHTYPVRGVQGTISRFHAEIPGTVWVSMGIAKSLPSHFVYWLDKTPHNTLCKDFQRGKESAAVLL